MKPLSFMVVAGEASGDALAAELVQSVRQQAAEGVPLFTRDYQPLHSSLSPRFYGAGGPTMAKAGVELELDLTQHAVVGLSEVLRHLFKFRRILQQLSRMAITRQPDALVCVDFSGFNRRLAHSVRRQLRTRGPFHNWKPLIVQFVSPQVWASREGRAYQMAADYDLVLSIFPFEKDWYIKRVPSLKVEFVGNPLIDRHRVPPEARTNTADPSPLVALLPGSRMSEINRHLPVIVEACERMERQIPDLRACIVLPTPELLEAAKAYSLPSFIKLQQGGLPDLLANAALAIASTGTVTMECALFGVPTVALYKTSWSTYEVGKRIVKVPFLAMPNILAGREVFPEFIQNAATPENLAQAGLTLLRDDNRRRQVKDSLAAIIASLGKPGASGRAASIILKHLPI
jgi:lipid-A-disaccharide synthase